MKNSISTLFAIFILQASTYAAAETSKDIACEAVIHHSSCFVESVELKINLGSLEYQYGSSFDMICGWPPAGFYYQGVASYDNETLLLDLNDHTGHRTVDLELTKDLTFAKIEDIVLKCTVVKTRTIISF